MGASCGHEWNQSMTVHEASAGNLRQRLRMPAPTGDMQSTTCRFLRTRSMKKFQQLSRESIWPAALTSGRMALMMLSVSSAVYRSGM